MDELIVKEFKITNEKYIKVFIDEYGGLISTIIRRTLGDLSVDTLVEECMSDVVLVVWNNINSFKGDKAAFKTWVCAIAKYKAIDYRRKMMKERNVESIEDVVIAHPSNLEEEVLLREKKKEILNKVKTLKLEDRDIFIRRYVMNEAIVDIADSYGVNRNYIDKKLHRIRKFLKEEFKEKEGNVYGR